MYTDLMARTFKEAIAEVAKLPDADQEQIGRALHSHVETLRQLRLHIDNGVRSLDAGHGSEINIEDLIRRKNKQYAGA